MWDMTITSRLTSYRALISCVSFHFFVHVNNYITIGTPVYPMKAAFLNYLFTFNMILDDCVIYEAQSQRVTNKLSAKPFFRHIVLRR